MQGAESSAAHEQLRVKPEQIGPFEDTSGTERSMALQLPPDLLFFAYLLVFGVAALACFVSIPRALRIDDPDTRRGVVALLVTSGGWATAHLLFLAAPTPELKTVFYVAGLVIGFSAVGPWLYFCSAYTGRSLHQNTLIRRAAVIVFLAVVMVKVTNPIHNLYFTAEIVTTPFPHLAIQNGVFHWLVMGLSYALAIVGYFMLLELFLQVSYDTKPFAILIAITGLPIVFDVIGFASPLLVNITYEPIGVAVFAVGVFYVYIDRFQAIQLAGGRDEPAIVLNANDQIRDYNNSAADLFPALAEPDVIGKPIGDVLPTIVDARHSDTAVIELDRNDVQRYYRLTHNSFGADQSQLGRLLILSDITHREQYRRELERQNERLDQFANMISHDLRNPLNVASGHLELAQEDCDGDHLETVADAHTRMEDLIEDVLALARQGQPIDETETVQFASVAGQCWQVVDTVDAKLVTDSDLRFIADADRLQQLLENLFRNAIEHGGTNVTIRVGEIDGERGFFVADDGPGIAPEQRDQVLESGYSTADEGTGFGLAIVKEIADAHGWTLTITESTDGGARFEITGVEVADE
ncbi:MAG: ATP-binding protein [Halanaeroarchaeum sp.]